MAQRGQEAVAYVSQYHLATFKCGCNSNSAGAMVSIIILSDMLHMLLQISRSEKN